MTAKTNRMYVSEYNQLLKECDTIYHSAAVKMGLSDCAFWILYTLQDTQKTYKQSDICDSASMSRQTVNSALKKLEKDGYLTLRRIDGKMGKSIHLTEKGNQFVQRNIMPIMLAEETACSLFSDDEKDKFLKTFHSLVERLKTEIENVLAGGEVNAE